MKANICDACLADDKAIGPSVLRAVYKTSIGRQAIDLCKKHENYIKDHGFEKLTIENEAEFYKFLTDMMHRAQENYHQIAYHSTNG